MRAASAYITQPTDSFARFIIIAGLQLLDITICWMWGGTNPRESYVSNRIPMERSPPRLCTWLNTIYVQKKYTRTQQHHFVAKFNSGERNERYVSLKNARIATMVSLLFFSQCVCVRECAIIFISLYRASSRCRDVGLAKRPRNKIIPRYKWILQLNTFCIFFFAR